MNKEQESKNRREAVSYYEKLEIMYRYLSENNAFGTGIKSRTTFQGYPIGQWQAYMRTVYYMGALKLDEQLEKRFLELGILKEERQRETEDRLTWDEKYVIMEEYLSAGNVIQSDTIYKGHKIGQWQIVLRHLGYNDRLTTVSPELKNKFFKAGILKKEKGKLLDTGPKKLSYEEKFEIMYRFLESTEFEQAIHQNTTFEGNAIGVWQDNLRQTYRRGRDLEISTELMEKFFAYGILREEDKNKRKEGRTIKEEKETLGTIEEDIEKEQLVEMLLKKQEQRKVLDEEIAELQRRIVQKEEQEL